MKRVAAITFFILLIASSAILLSCARTPQKPAEPSSKPSEIKITVNDGGPVVITTATAEFQVLPSGYVQASLLKGGSKLTLDEERTGVPTDSNYVISGGNQLRFAADFGQAQVLEAIGKMGRGNVCSVPVSPVDS